MTFPMKNSVLDNFPLCPPVHPPPEKRKFYFIVVSLSLKRTGKRLSRVILVILQQCRIVALCGITVAVPISRRDNALASSFECPLYVPPF